MSGLEVAVIVHVTGLLTSCSVPAGTLTEHVTEEGVVIEPVPHDVPLTTPDVHAY